jgi:hypothetical protein
MLGVLGLALVASPLSSGAWAQVLKPAPSSPAPGAPAPPPKPFVDDREGKLGLNFGAGPLVLLNLNENVRKISETGIGVEARFGYELRFGLVPELVFDYAHYLLKGFGSAVSVDAIAIFGGARYIYRAGALNPYASLGGGFITHQASGAIQGALSETAVAVNVGGGLNIRITTNAYFEVGIRYLAYFSDDLVSALMINAAVTLFY